MGETLKLTGLVTSFRGTVACKTQWLMGKKSIKKATRSKLKIISALRGKVILVKGTAVSGGATKTRKIKVGKVG